MLLNFFLFIYLSLLVNNSFEVREIAKNGPFGARRTYMTNGSELNKGIPLDLKNSNEAPKHDYWKKCQDSNLTNSDTDLRFKLVQCKEWKQQQKYMRNWLNKSVNDMLERSKNVKTELEKVADKTHQNSVLQKKKIFDLNRQHPQEVAILNFIKNQVLKTASRQGQFTTNFGKRGKPYGVSNEI